ncbi:glycosyl hydrolase family 95 catalytic domain-containing protein [Hymenobacter sp. GOD-10R]|uniref:glycosyl hydrolase family 95 catalytic domain-containing protein n=1 Tax=Hymenobacter sp. GOD-10R TaxID=3093922 RepID=UPI002D778CD2|nr:glycoside hydrolase N-terminal domain-containing protein [Hymenobacter sp. GOD-10R]WRQ31095.1 glycoside hydrolase N-terminal domain-containing protein [Hymenobacter sp. GOD-10R]
MRKGGAFCFLAGFFFLALAVRAQPATAPFATPVRGFSSWQPAASWEHALISGNGTLGALVMGQPHDETIILSHGQLFLPLNPPKPPINQASRLPEIRQLLLAGKYTEAAKVPVDEREKEGFTIGRDPFMPAFDLRLTQSPGNVRRYQRSTNFQTGEATVEWEDSHGTFQRRLFVSRPDSMVVLSIKGTGKINGRLRFEHRPIEWNQWQLVGGAVGEMRGQAEGQWLTYRSEFKNKYPGGLQGYEGAGRLVLTGGSARVEQNDLVVSDADEVLLLIKIKPSYNYSHSQLPQLKQELGTLNASYADLLARHAKVHGALFNRARLDLHAPATDRQLYSEELLLKARTEVPLALVEKTFDAGRYNIISAMGANPPNLQGIWSGTWTAPWSGDFTHDGNIQSAIGSVLNSNMAELMPAYFRYHERLLPTYRENARRLYGTRGIHVPVHTSNTGLDTDFGDVWCLTLWTGGAGWTANAFFDYYQYTGDQQFLAQHAYPFLKETAQFYEDFLTLGKDGHYVFNPSYSPENNPANGTSQAALNATMDVMIAKQVLRNSILAANTLRTDKAQVKKWQAMLAKLPTYEVSPDGTLREWLWPGFEENYKHRHASHLYGLYDQVDPEIGDSPALRAAANRAIVERLKFRQAEGGGEMAFGLVQLGLASAHLGDAEKAHQLTEWLASKYWSTGMGSFHNVGNLFNTDISGGLPAVLIEMLTYSEPGLVSLLPALPAQWPAGEVQGVRLRGQIEVKSLRWDGQQVAVTLHSDARQSVRLQLPRASKPTGPSSGLRRSDAMHYQVNLPAGQDVQLAFLLQ